MERARRVRGDRGDIVLGWLTKLVVVLSALGLIGFDVIAVVQTHFQAEDRAGTAARAAAEAYQANPSTQRAYDAAYATLDVGESIETTTFRVTPDGAVSLRLRREATTLLLHRIGPLADRAVAVGTGQAKPVR